LEAQLAAKSEEYNRCKEEVEEKKLLAEALEEGEEKEAAVEALERSASKLKLIRQGVLGGEQAVVGFASKEELEHQPQKSPAMRNLKYILHRKMTSHSHVLLYAWHRNYQDDLKRTLHEAKDQAERDKAEAHAFTHDDWVGRLKAEKRVQQLEIANKKAEAHNAEMGDSLMDLQDAYNLKQHKLRSVAMRTVAHSMGRILKGEVGACLMAWKFALEDELVTRRRRVEKQQNDAEDFYENRFGACKMVARVLAQRSRGEIGMRLVIWRMEATSGRAAMEARLTTTNMLNGKHAESRQEAGRRRLKHAVGRQMKGELWGNLFAWRGATKAHLDNRRRRGRRSLSLGQLRRIMGRLTRGLMTSILQRWRSNRLGSLTAERQRQMVDARERVLRTAEESAAVQLSLERLHRQQTSEVEARVRELERQLKLQVESSIAVRLAMGSQLDEERQDRRLELEQVRNDHIPPLVQLRSCLVELQETREGFQEFQDAAAQETAQHQQEVAHLKAELERARPYVTAYERFTGVSQEHGASGHVLLPSEDRLYEGLGLVEENRVKHDLDQMLAASLGSSSDSGRTRSQAEVRADVLFEADGASSEMRQGLVPLLTALRGTHPGLIEEMAAAVAKSHPPGIPKLALPGQRSRNDSALVTNLARPGEFV